MSGVPDIRRRGIDLRAAVVALWCMLAPCGACAKQFIGRVVGIRDEDTISVLREGKAVKVRLHGVDAPEKAQPFNTKARQLTGDPDFQRDVTVVIHTTDRYGSLMGEVLLPDGRSVGTSWYVLGWPGCAPGTALGVASTTPCPLYCGASPPAIYASFPVL